LVPLFFKKAAAFFAGWRQFLPGKFGLAGGFTGIFRKHILACFLLKPV